MTRRGRQHPRRQVRRALRGRISRRWHQGLVAFTRVPHRPSSLRFYLFNILRHKAGGNRAGLAVPAARTRAAPTRADSRPTRWWVVTRWSSHARFRRPACIGSRRAAARGASARSRREDRLCMWPSRSPERTGTHRNASERIDAADLTADPSGPHPAVRAHPDGIVGYGVIDGAARARRRHATGRPVRQATTIDSTVSAP